MFGLFNKKEEKVETQHPEFLKLVEKWESFLGKMEIRFNESLVNAEEALLDNLVESNYDINPTMIAWSGIKSQLQGLRTKIDTTFNERVSPQMLEYIERWDLIDEDQKGVRLGEGFLDKIERFEITLEGKIAKRFYNHAVKHLNENFKCTQCSAKIEVNKKVFHTHYVSCDYCNTVNTFTPNNKITQIRWAVDNIAKFNVITEWDTMTKAQRDFHDIRPPSEDQDKTEYIKAYKNREDTERLFWTKYFTERSEFLPDYKETIEYDVDNKMKWFYEERQRELNF